MHTRTSPPIEAAAARRTFGDVTAVDSVDLRIDHGEVVALLGPNGAGKTTFLDMVLGLIAPTSGTVRTMGLQPEHAVRTGRTSAVLQTGGLLDDLSVAETVRMIASCHLAPVPGDAVLHRAGLWGIRGRRVRACSGGERQRLRFALALLTSPELLLLDEPTAGMDVRARAEFWQTMHDEARDGRTIVFATHYLAEAADFADRVVLMRGGRIHSDGTVEQLTATRSRTLTCRWRGPLEGEDGPAAAADRFSAELVRTPGPQDRAVFRAQQTDPLAHALLSTGTAADLEITRASLDDVFLDLTEGDGR